MKKEPVTICAARITASETIDIIERELGVLLDRLIKDDILISIAFIIH
jgi:hypothetical protein